MIGRKRGELDKNLLELLAMFLIITMNTLIVNTNPVLTKETFGAMRKACIEVSFNMIFPMRTGLL